MSEQKETRCSTLLAVVSLRKFILNTLRVPPPEGRKMLRLYFAARKQPKKFPKEASVLPTFTAKILDETLQSTTVTTCAQKYQRLPVNFPLSLTCIYMQVRGGGRQCFKMSGICHFKLVNVSLLANYRVQ